MKTFFFLFMLFVSSLTASYKYELSVCMIFRDEAPYLKEWIEFHRLLGVEHFYLYNNLSKDNYKEVLRPYIKQNIVELFEWNQESTHIRGWDSIQVAAYNDGFKRAKAKTKWLALLDCDEFLFPVVENSIPEFLRPFEKKKRIGGVLVSWVCFGTSWVKKIPKDKLLIESLVLCVPKGTEHYKSIFLTKHVSHVCSPHYVVYKEGYCHCTPNQKLPPFDEIDKIRINHYWSRDEWFLYHFKIPRRSIWGTDAATCLHWAEASNVAEDKTIFRFVPTLRKRIFGK